MITTKLYYLKMMINFKKSLKKLKKMKIIQFTNKNNNIMIFKIYMMLERF